MQQKCRGDGICLELQLSLVPDEVLQHRASNLKLQGMREEG